MPGTDTRPLRQRDRDAILAFLRRHPNPPWLVGDHVGRYYPTEGAAED